MTMQINFYTDYLRRLDAEMMERIQAMRPISAHDRPAYRPKTWGAHVDPDLPATPGALLNQTDPLDRLDRTDQPIVEHSGV